MLSNKKCTPSDQSVLGIQSCWGIMRNNITEELSNYWQVITRSKIPKIPKMPQ